MRQDISTQLVADRLEIAHTDAAQSRRRRLRSRLLRGTAAQVAVAGLLCIGAATASAAFPTSGAFDYPECKTNYHDITIEPPVGARGVSYRYSQLFHYRVFLNRFDPAGSGRSVQIAVSPWRYRYYYAGGPKGLWYNNAGQDLATGETVFDTSTLGYGYYSVRIQTYWSATRYQHAYNDMTPFLTMHATDTSVGFPADSSYGPTCLV